MIQNRYRTVFISDIHLGSKRSKTKALHQFLQHIETETLVLLGDVVDVWAMKKRWYWPQQHTNTIRRLLTFAKKGTRVIYIPGNHDDLFREYDGLQFGEIEIKNELIHQTVDGRKIWLIHGDQFDIFMRPSYRFLTFFGDFIYRFLLSLNRLNNRLRKWRGKPYWSLSEYLKTRTDGFLKIIARFEHNLSMAAKQKGYDGIICGHIHHAAVKNLNSVQYFNTGDWVESCTALAEDYSGAIELIRWNDAQEKLPAQKKEAESTPKNNHLWLNLF
jgi:UDP-2,3-diacylglucosamine pyrophosphatase LpxH